MQKISGRGVGQSQEVNSELVSTVGFETLRKGKCKAEYVYTEKGARQRFAECNGNDFIGGRS